MRPYLVLPLAVACLSAPRPAGVTDTSHSPHVKMRSFPLQDVRWTSGFWADRFTLASGVMIPAMWQSLQVPANGASYRNLRVAAGLEQGAFQSTHWSDGDVYKWLESVAHVYAVTQDAKLDRLMDEVIEVIGKAQAPDGYISTQIQNRGWKRWQNLSHHELYNMGHLLTAAAIHYRATGKDSLLAVARRTAGYLYTVFQPRPRALAHFGFNPSQIMGLVELYRATGERKYLELAGIFVEMRGSAPGGTDENQSRVPLLKETEAVGHAVAGPYLWAGAADVYAETGEAGLWAALERLWSSVTERRMYVTGAIGAINRGVSSRGDNIHEAFGLDYQLPNRIAYTETCANIAGALWAWRMLAATAEARYADAMELVLYNSMLSGMSLAGTEFFYTNPLRRFAAELAPLRMESPERWADSSRKGAPHSYCCPPNVLRMLAGMHEYAYGYAGGAVYVNLYGSNTLATRLPGGAAVRLRQETKYPWEGGVLLTLEGPGEFAVRLRIPSWAEVATLKVNGRAEPPPKAGAYAEVRRSWKAGDRIELALPLEPRLVEANPLVEENWSQVAVVRGPIVYCLESHELPAGVRFHEVALPARVRLRARFDPTLLGGVTVLEGKARLARRSGFSGALYRTLQPASGEVDLRLIPYYAWANRGISYMTVWLPLAQ